MWIGFSQMIAPNLLGTTGLYHPVFRYLRARKIVDQDSERVYTIYFSVL